MAQAVQLTAKRAGDHVARYGGEEFAVIAPNCDGPQAAELARRVGAAVDALRVPHPASVQPWVSLSIGYAMAGPDETPDSLIRRSDAALYRAKAAGRHQAQEALASLPALHNEPPPAMLPRPAQQRRHWRVRLRGPTLQSCCPTPQPTP